MDQFVRDQLTLADCTDLIPLFRDRGYDEAAFRKLTMPKLAYLLPDDKEYRRVLGIWSTIMCLDPVPGSSTSTGFLPPPGVIVKTEPLEHEPGDIVKTEPLEHEPGDIVKTGEPIPALLQDDVDEDLMVNDTIGSPPLENEAEQLTDEDEDGDLVVNDNDTSGSPPLENEAELAEHPNPPQDDVDEDLLVNDTIGAPPLENEAEQLTALDDDDEVEIVQELESIDEFVKCQLTSIGCEGLIELFKGYNEEAYRKLNNKKLMQLLPDDDDGELAFKIMCNIRWLNTPDHDRSIHSAVPFPPPTVVVKTEPLEAGPEHGDDDEVQIVGRTIRNPSAFTVVEIKQERPEQISENEDVPVSSSSSSIPSPSINDSNRNKTDNIGGIPADNTLAEGAGNEGNAATADAAHDNGCSDNGGHALRSRGSRKRLGDTMTVDAADVQLKAKRSKEAEAENSWQKFLHMLFGQTTTGLTKAKLENFGENLEFKLSTTQLDDVLRILETYCGHLRHFVKKLSLTIPPKDDDVISISNQHLQRLANLPQTFLNQLIKLSFNLRFPESTDFSLITALLSRCPSLKEFEVQRGTVLKGDKAVSFKVPKMDRLVSFCYVTEINLAGPRYQQPPTRATVTVDVERDTYASNVVFFQVDFSNITFPALEKLCVGPSIQLQFENLSQFPNMITFNPGNVRYIMPLPWLNGTDSTCNDVTFIGLIGMAKIELIQLTPRAFPNITKLSLVLPSVSTLRSVITHMDDMHIENFQAQVNFEFESAFFTAFCGHPFKLVTEHDRLKLDKLQKYKYWKKFMKHLGIGVPTGETSDASLSKEESNDEVAMMANEPEPTTISSFKFLRTFSLRHIRACIFLPETDTHWSSPDVQLSSSRWSSMRQKLPSAILLEELSKLKGQLRCVRLHNFEVDQDTIAQFQEIMGLKINFDPWYSTRALGVDTLSSTDLPGIKLEN